MANVFLLPPQTTPPDEVLIRRHTPAAVGKNYTVFRDCLRWEFGFTCAICLLHERDIQSYGAQGWGVMHVEHMEPQSINAKTVGAYSNLLYICRLCNGARSDTAREDRRGRRLLDPTEDVWSQHFAIANDHLHFARDNSDADYTADVYNINDPRKVRLRQARREHVQRLLAELASERDELVRLERSLPRADPLDFAAMLASLEDRLERLRRRFTGQMWVPEDAPSECRCGRWEARTLPSTYMRQCMQMTTI